MTICIYHGIDLDGWTSAAIVKEKYMDCIMIPYDYGQPVPDLPDGDLIIVDVSFSTETFRKFLNEGRKVLWIDHHISAIREFDKNLRYEIQNNPFFQFAIDPTKAACELTWETINVGQDMPEAVRLLGRYDCFGHMGTFEELEVLLFQYAARAKWDSWQTATEALHLDKTAITKMYEEGRYIYSSLVMEAKQIYEKRFDMMFDGHLFAAVNRDRFNPINFGIDFHQDGYAGFCSFYYDRGIWKFSLYSNGVVDCSDICLRRGGGGHAGAAGFTATDILPFLRIVYERI